VRLSIQVEGELEGGGLETVRGRLKNVVKNMELGLWTDIVMAYMKGHNIFVGIKSLSEKIALAS
jgi:hypothetical protein